jgi:hypothetical protein
MGLYLESSALLRMLFGQEGALEVRRRDASSPPDW